MIDAHLHRADRSPSMAGADPFLLFADLAPGRFKHQVGRDPLQPIPAGALRIRRFLRISAGRPVNRFCDHTERPAHERAGTS